MKLLKKIQLLPDALKGQLFSSPERNGEYKFLNKILSSKESLIIFDVGANVGTYTEKILSINKNCSVYCFEPVKSTFSKLSTKLGKLPNVTLNNFALGDMEKEDFIFIYGENFGINSLYYLEKYAQLLENQPKEKIRIQKLDDVIKQLKISTIDFLKIDVEGHELKVLKGAEEALNTGKIKTIQFEYNIFWQKSGSKLEEVFNLLSSIKYKFSRLTPWGKIAIKSYNRKLENYKHSNYVASTNE